MNRIVIVILLAFLGYPDLYSQEEHEPSLVREGVSWHYNRVYGDQPMEEECVMFFKGDSIINDVVYKKCIKVTANGNQRVEALMREENKMVYSIGGITTDDPTPGEYNHEIILYDFENPSKMFPSYLIDDFELKQTTVEIGGIKCNCYTYDDFNKMIEGIGLDGSGTLTEHVFDVLTSTHYQYTGLAYVEKDGKVIYRGSAYEDSYQPLVREGVRWKCAETRYRYDEPIMSTSYYWYEFKGDTIINGRNYFKLFRTTQDGHTEIPCDSQYPLAYMRNDGHRVMASGVKKYDENAEFLFNVFDILRQEGDEYVLYDFDNPSDAYTIDYPFMPADSVLIGDCPFAQVAWTLGSNDILCAGVGWDLCEGDPFVLMVPIATSPYHNEYGFVGLYDLDGNVLYKGACFGASPSGDLTGDGQVDISDVNAAIDVMLGKSAADADITGDGQVDIADVNAIIDQMLGKR